MKPERDVFQRRFLTLVAVSLVWLGPAVSTGQEVAQEEVAQGEVAQGEAKQNATGKLVPAETPVLDDANGSDKSPSSKSPSSKSPSSKSPSIKSPSSKVAKPENTKPDSVSGSIATGTPNDATQRAIKGMIDGDANAAVPVSIIPQVLTDAEREKLGMTQSRFQLPALAAASTALPDGQGDGDRYPETFVQQFGQFSEALPETGTQRSTDWHWSLSQWAAANTFSNPRYFEDRMLERHGQQQFGCLQPLASGARFFGTVPMLPYLWTVSDPCDCEYTLGYFHAGECVPIMMQRPPYENRAVIVETGAAAAVIIGLP